MCLSMLSFCLLIEDVDPKSLLIDIISMSILDNVLEDAGQAKDARPVSFKLRDAVQLIAHEGKQAKAIMLQCFSRSRRIISNTVCLQSPTQMN